MKDVTTVYRLWINGASEGDYTNRINAIRAAKAGLTKSRTLPTRSVDTLADTMPEKQDICILQLPRMV